MYEKNYIYLHIYIFDRTLGTTQLLALIHLHVLQDNLPPFHAMFHFFLQTEQRMSVDLLKNLLLSLLEFLWVRLSRASHCKITCNWNYCWKDSQEFLSAYHLECLLELSEVSVSKVVVSLGKIIRSVF